MMAKTERISLRVTADQKARLELAAAATATSVSGFVLAAAIAAAAEVLADRRSYVLGAAAWDTFNDALNRPARDIPGLRKLLSTPTVLDDPEPVARDEAQI